MSRFRIVIFAFLLSALLVACGGGQAKPELAGRWQGGQDWGEVVFAGMRGTYSSTSGTNPGEIVVTMNADGTYSGTWGEGTDRYGTLELSFESKDVLVGSWEADPGSALVGSSAGLIRWERE